MMTVQSTLCDFAFPDILFELEYDSLDEAFYGLKRIGEPSQDQRALIRLDPITGSTEDLFSLDTIKPFTGGSYIDPNTGAYTFSAYFSSEPLDSCRVVSLDISSGQVVHAPTTEHLVRSLEFFDPRLTAIDERGGQSEVNIFPNPASDKLHIEAGEMIRSYRIFNAQGTLIESADNGAREFEIDVSHWLKGYYTLELQGAFRSIYRPIIITY